MTDLLWLFWIVSAFQLRVYIFGTNSKKTAGLLHQFETRRCVCKAVVSLGKTLHLKLLLWVWSTVHDRYMSDMCVMCICKAL